MIRAGSQDPLGGYSAWEFNLKPHSPRSPDELFTSGPKWPVEDEEINLLSKFLQDNRF